MKYSLLFVPLVIGVSIAQAQTSTPTSTESELPAERPVPEEIREEVEERRAALSERQQERITNLTANMSNRFDAIIIRLNTILDRLERRIDKEEAAGKSVSDARTFLDTARTSLVAASQNMSDIDAEVTSVVGAEDPRAVWPELRNTYTTTRDLVRSAHADLRAAILILKNPPTAAQENNEIVE